MINLLTVVARQHQQSAGAKRLVNGLGYTFADPVQIRTLVLIEVEEGKYRYRIGGPAEGRRRQQPDKKKRNPTHL
jgi:hypothetical protein